MRIIQEATQDVYDMSMCGGSDDYAYDPDSNCVENNQ